MEPVIVTQLFDTSVEKLWNVLSIESELKKWYFQVQNYEFIVGNTFTFYESADSKEYLHECKYLQIIPQQLIEHTWAHPSHSKGSSVLKWVLTPEGEQTRLTLTHTGIENFADGGETFTKANFEMGWNAIIKTTLRNYLYGINKLEFNIEINAPSSKVWQQLWGIESYTAWTKPFCEGSYYEGKIEQGSRVHLLSPSGEGMYSDIIFYKENELLIFQHIGVLKDKTEMPIDAATEKWTGCFEIYKLKEVNGKTELKVEVDTVPEYEGFMQKTFPLAMAELKELSENS